MIAADAPLVVFVDVDDTFVRSYSTKRIPVVRTIKHVESLHAQGAILYCWSAGGADYAKRSAEEMGIAKCFVAFLPKPNVLIDDQMVASWRTCLEINSFSLEDEGIVKYRLALQKK